MEDNNNQIGLGIGIGQSLYNTWANGNKTSRRREQEVNQALKQIDQEREILLRQNPELTAQRQRGVLESGKANAVNVGANAGAGIAASSGLGGDINSAVVAGIKASAPVVQASQPYDQAIAQTHEQAYQDNANKINQLGHNSDQTSATAYNYTDYINGHNGQKLDLINAAQGGVTAEQNIRNTANPGTVESDPEKMRRLELSKTAEPMDINNPPSEQAVPNTAQLPAEHPLVQELLKKNPNLYHLLYKPTGV